MAIDNNSYESSYSEADLWRIMKRNAAKIPGLKRVLVLYYVMRDETTPLWAKTLIIAALGYVICPVDLIPDLIPVAGWSDDAGVVGSAFATVRVFIDDLHEELAEQALKELLS